MRCTFSQAAAAIAACLSLPAPLIGAGSSAAEPADQRLAQTILATAGVKGGLIVHLGCGDGRLTAALRVDAGYCIHGLDSNPAKVLAARQYLSGRGVYGPVSVEHLVGGTLPYADNLVNLVVVEDRSLASRDEILRVLAPQGVACLKSGSAWEKLVKPRPAEIDEWTHFLHDAGNNAVARDLLVGPPRDLQWVAPPLWLRSHETPSGIQGLVSAGGRLFYYFDEGLVGITDQRLPERWALLCRDAFNGKLLWRRPVEPWGWPQWAKDQFADKDWTTIRGGRTMLPDDNQRRLVAIGDRLYATLGYRAPLAILDAATGNVRTTVQGTEPVAEILAVDNIVLVHAREPMSSFARRRGARDEKPSKLIAVQGDTGKVLWKHDGPAIPSLQVAIDAERVIYQAAATLTSLSLANGQRLWETPVPKGATRTLIAHQGVVLTYAGDELAARDAATGRLLWKHEVPPSAGDESPDLFVVDGVVWRGMVPVGEDLHATKKSADAMALGFDLRTGEEKRRVVVHNLRSPEHHHRCYRNKATERFIISGMEGAEFMDLSGDGHSQNNWLRGACRLGIMPCNGLLYVPADQCFCQPGAKLLGFAAVAAESSSRNNTVADGQRLEKGEAYGAADQSGVSTPDDWPTLRHDPARHGSTASAVSPQIVPAWRSKLGGKLTAPVAANRRVYVAAIDAHTLYALDAATGKTVWTFIAGGRIDSPPTIHQGMVLFGSADGRVYCLRAADGALAWRFLAAPRDCRVGSFDQFESAWPVHGSVLVREGVAYATAGRSTYLDGGIRLWGLEPSTGKMLYKNTLAGPFPDCRTGRDEGFWVPGANSDVLVADGEYLYMRQKKFTPELRAVDVPVLSNKGEQDVGLHLFSTAGLLDDSGYNRVFWMYSKRWPGFQLANQAPKSGQLLAVDGDRTYAVNGFYRRNVHSTMFFPAKEGYLLFADKNTTEPQIVGEDGSHKPVAWLPQSDIPRPGGQLDGPAFGLDKMIGYTRAEPPLWSRWLQVRVRAMVKTRDVLFVAGSPDVLEADDPYAAFEGRNGGRLVAVAARDGAKLAEYTIDSPPVFDGLIAAGGRLLVALEDGSLACFAGQPSRTGSADPGRERGSAVR